MDGPGTVPILGGMTNYQAAARLRCPRCGEGALFRGWASLNETCPSCGARFERWAGSWTGAVVGGYGVGAAAAVISLFVLWRLDHLVPNIEFLVAGIAIVATLATYRHTKSFWIAAMHHMGYVYPDPPSTPAEGSRTVPHAGGPPGSDSRS